MRMKHVGIIGGGPGGLMTAYLLEKMADTPVSITLFEASHRLGGKVLTPRFHHVPVRYEAGAAEFYDYAHFDEDPLKDLIAELGLSIGRMGGSAVIMRDQIISNLEDIREHLGPHAQRELTAFDQLAKDRINPAEFFHSDHPDGAPHPPDDRRFDTLLAGIAEPATRQFVEHLIHSDLATEPHRTSITYGLQNYLMNDPAYMQLYSIVGGNEQLPRELAARIHATTLLEHRVERVDKQGNKLRVTSHCRGVSRTDEFDYVVVALPHNSVPNVTFAGEHLSAAVREHQSHYDHPAHYLRVTILFDRPFWRSRLSDSFWMLDSFGGCCLYDESSREPGHSHGILGWLLGGEIAREMSSWDDDRLIAAALDSLPEFLQSGREHFLEGRVHRWVGAVNAMPGGDVYHNLDQRHRPEPRQHAELLFVGDYLFDSTLNGVLDSAEYVASCIAGELAERSTVQTTPLY